MMGSFASAIEQQDLIQPFVPCPMVQQTTALVMRSLTTVFVFVRSKYI
jgi:hypothetical protein